MSQIHLFHGENSYLLRCELKRWKDQFEAKHGRENLLKLDGKRIKYRDVLDDLSSAPFIAEKRLIIIDGIPSWSKEEIQELEKELHPDVLLLFCDPKPDKRLGAVKELLRVAEVKEFTTLSPGQLQQWVRTTLSEKGATAENSAIKLLLDTVGDNQEAIMQEITKLATFVQDRPITDEDVELLAMRMGEELPWHLFDLLASGKRDEALQYMSKLMQQGESPHALWNRLLWMIGSLTQVWTAVDEGQSSPGAIAKSIDMGFGTVRTLLPLARNLSRKEMMNIVTNVAEADIALKSGGYKATAEAPQELQALLERTIATVAS